MRGTHGSAVTGSKSLPKLRLRIVSLEVSMYITKSIPEGIIPYMRWENIFLRHEVYLVSIADAKCSYGAKHSTSWPRRRYRATKNKNRSSSMGETGKSWRSWHTVLDCISPCVLRMQIQDRLAQVWKRHLSLTGGRQPHHSLINISLAPPPARDLKHAKGGSININMVRLSFECFGRLRLERMPLMGLSVGPRNRTICSYAKGMVSLNGSQIAPKDYLYGSSMCRANTKYSRCSITHLLGGVWEIVDYPTHVLCSIIFGWCPVTIAGVDCVSSCSSVFLFNPLNRVHEKD